MKMVRDNRNKTKNNINRKLREKETAQVRREAILEKWAPKTEIGKLVKAGEIKDMEEVLNSGKRILESEIVDTLIPNLEYDLLAIGQSKGKFGGGKRSIWKQTQKKTKEGNKPKFATVAVVGNKNGYIGIGYGKSKETVPAREKAVRNAKLNLMKIRRGSGSWADAYGDPHTVPFKIVGKCGSVQVTLMPAAKGTGLIVQKELKKILNLAGFEDVYSKTKGKTTTALNLIKACIDALSKLNAIKVNEEFIKKTGLIEGKLE